MVSNTHRFRVIYGDTDMAGIVYYANYLRFFEAGRSELLRARGLPYSVLEQRGLQLPVASAEVQYRAPARYEDELDLETRVLEVKNVSLKVAYRLVRPADGVLIATGQTMHACVDRVTGRVSRLPPEYKAALGVAVGA